MIKNWIEELDKLMTSKGFVGHMPGNSVGPSYDRDDILVHLWFKMVETHEYKNEVDRSYMMISTDCVPFYIEIWDNEIDTIEYYLDEVFIPMLQKHELYEVLVASRDSGMWSHPFEKGKVKHKFTELTGLEVYEREYTPKEIKAIDNKIDGVKPTLSRKLPSSPNV